MIHFLYIWFMNQILGRPLVYISGKITAPTKEEIEYNRSLFYIKEKELTKKGYIVVNPCRLEKTTNKTWTYYMRIDLRALLWCEKIYMLKNWTTSNGANTERELANQMQMEIFYEDPKSSSEYLNGEGYKNRILKRKTIGSELWNQKDTPNELNFFGRKFTQVNEYFVLRKKGTNLFFTLELCRVPIVHLKSNPPRFHRWDTFKEAEENIPNFEKTYEIELEVQRIIEFQDSASHDNLRTLLHFEKMEFEL